MDLTRGVGYGPEFRGDYQVTSAPTVVGDLVITGSSIGDNGAVDMPRGVVRGYDARTGALRWTWDPIPWAEKQQVRTGAANAWSTIRGRPRARSGVHPHRQRQPRLLRRRASRATTSGRTRWWP